MTLSEDLRSLTGSLAEELGKSAVTLRRDLHQHPELSGKEKLAAGHEVRVLLRRSEDAPTAEAVKR